MISPKPSQPVLKGDRVQQKRTFWNKLAIPPELSEILREVSLIEGYSADKMWLLVYHMLKEQYPEATTHLVAAWKAGWLDEETPD